jgi:hypothetical protein
MKRREFIAGLGCVMCAVVLNKQGRRKEVARCQSNLTEGSL